MNDDTSPPVTEVDVDGLAAALDAGAVLVDVRNPDEWLEARVPGVPLIPLPEFAERLAEVPAGDPVHVICKSGGRSLRACELLAASGRSAVNVAGGTDAWVASGRPVESGPA